MPGEMALVLDDIHLITAHEVHEGLKFLLENSPHQLHLVVCGRADPPWPLARLRARSEMVELRARDLRFTVEAATVFMNDTMGLNLSPDDVAALEDRTEGWIAGLQMAALSMQGRTDISAFVRAFSGSHRFILDYLVEEVLSRQSSAVHDFLLKTSILERLNASLCDAVAGIQTSDVLLTELEQANLFVVPLDEERHWYRYHRLFADLLRSRLQDAAPDQLAELHLEASKWYEGRGVTVQAVGHALLAEDVEQIEHLIAGNALAAIYHGELATVSRWLDSLPGEILRSRPRLSIAHAWVLAYAGRLEAVEASLRDAEGALDGADAGVQVRYGDDEARHLRGYIAAIRAYIMALQEDLSSAVRLATYALDQIPEAPSTERGWTALLLGCVLRSQGQLRAADQAFSDAVTISEEIGDTYLAVDALWESAVHQLAYGRLHEALRMAEQALELANDHSRRTGRRLPVLGYTFHLMSRVMFQWNELEKAVQFASEGVELSKQWGQADALVQGSFHLARVLEAVGKMDEALGVLHEVKPLAGNLGPWYRATAVAHEAHIRLAQGNLSVATHLVEEMGWSAAEELVLDYRFVSLTIARTLIARGRMDEALGLLKRFVELAESAGAVGSLIETLVVQAVALHAAGDSESAVISLERALNLAEPEGYVRVFIDEGNAMGELLRTAASQGIAVKYVTKLLTALAEELGEISGLAKRSLSSESARPSVALAEPLSERELQVLRMLNTHLSIPEIAEELIVAPSTIRSHVKSIYGKLGAHSRHEAVDRAKGLRLL
jgi:LuxR family maltose regulon positive regulatory protein